MGFPLEQVNLPNEIKGVFSRSWPYLLAWVEPQPSDGAAPAKDGEAEKVTQETHGIVRSILAGRFTGQPSDINSKELIASGWRLGDYACYSVNGQSVVVAVLIQPGATEEDVEERLERVRAQLGQKWRELEKIQLSGRPRAEPAAK